MKQELYRKIIAFDLSKAELKKSGFSGLFPMALKPYNQIQAEMKNLGFLHLQKSVYKSKDVMSDTDLTAIIKDLDQKLPWLCDCVSKIHTADIINEQSFDLNEILQATNITRKQYERTRFTVEADKR